MAALEPGAQAPDFSIFSLDGAKTSLAQLRAAGPVVLAFYKAACPVCQYAFPYLQRIFKKYGDAKVKMVAVSQDNKAETKDFLKHFGITFPALVDDAGSYPTSSAYGLTNVPSVFLVSKEGKIEQSIVGWVKSEMEALNESVARASDKAAQPLFSPGEDVMTFRPG